MKLHEKQFSSIKVNAGPPSRHCIESKSFIFKQDAQYFNEVFQKYHFLAFLLLTTRRKMILGSLIQLKQLKIVPFQSLLL